MPWSLSTLLANKKSPDAAIARRHWPAEEMERLASGIERAQLFDGREEAV